MHVEKKEQPLGISAEDKVKPNGQSQGSSPDQGPDSTIFVPITEEPELKDER